MFAKVFHQIFDSSIANDPYLRHFFTDLLLLANRDGVVDMTPQAIAARTRLPEGDVKRWIEALEQADPDSRSAEEEGRRLVRIDTHRTWGWQIVNFRRYWESANREMLRMSESARKQAYRQRHSPKASPPHTPPKKETEGSERVGESDMSRTCPGHVPDREGWPTLETVILFASSSDISKECAEKWWHEHQARGGNDRYGQPIKFWKSALCAYAVSWRAQEAREGARGNFKSVRKAQEPIQHSKGFFK